MVIGFEGDMTKLFAPLIAWTNVEETAPLSVIAIGAMRKKQESDINRRFFLALLVICIYSPYSQLILAIKGDRFNNF